jgi:hypothetical protein
MDGPAVPTNRTPISRPRHPSFSPEILELFRRLETTPPRRRSSGEFKAGSKRLAALLGLTTQWWAMKHVEDDNKHRPREGLAAHDYWLTVRTVRQQLLEATGTAPNADVKKSPRHAQRGRRSRMGNAAPTCAAPSNRASPTRPFPMPPIALSEDQMLAVLAASHPLPPHLRSAFLETCARELANLPAIGDGAVHRVVMAAQRLYFDPPHLGTYGKYR